MQNEREFARYLGRDGQCVCGCFGREDTLVPQHRINRGMGGSKLLDRPSNIIVMCSLMNSIIESNADAANLAIHYGWKLRRSQKPEEEQFFDMATRQWYLADNEYKRSPAEPPERAWT